MMKKITLIPLGGLGNRIFAIASTIAFCKKNNFELEIFWFKDWGMGADFHSLFELSGELLEQIKIVDGKGFDYRYDRPRKKNLWLPYFWQIFAFDKRIYEKEMFKGLQAENLENIMRKNDSLYLVNCSSFYEIPEMYCFLQPQDYLKEKIQKQCSFFENKRVIGLHLRRNDHVISIKNSPLSLFVSKIEEELSFDKETIFYVASDSIEEKIKLKELFGDSILTSMETTQRDTKEGIVDALVELYTLSSTQKIYGSDSSTFSILAAKISDIPIEFLSLLYIH